MTINMPPRIRQVLYGVTALGTPLVIYLLDRKIIGAFEVKFWMAEVAVIATMAAFNISSDNK